MRRLPRLVNRGAAPVAAALMVLAVGLADARPASAQSAETLYKRALARERQVRDSGNRVTLAQMRAAIRAHETVVRRYPRSGYCDNALWQAANLAVLAFERYGEAQDRRTAQRLFELLRDGYPSSDFVPRARTALRDLEDLQVEKRARAEKASTSAATKAAPVNAEARAVDRADDKRTSTSSAGGDAPADGIVTIRDITRTQLPDGVRVTIEMDGESLYRADRLENPDRVFFDLKNTRTTTSLQDATIRFDGEIIKEIRLGRHPQNTTRIVMHLESPERYSVFTLYNPFRLVVDFRREGATSSTTPVASAPAPPPVAPAAAREATPPPADKAVDRPATVPAAKEAVPMVARPAPPPDLTPPAVPATNANGQFSIARQLGLGISRIVLDAGHGGHDPGAQANGLTEAELVLDVTLRLRALLEKEPGIEVTLTRDKDVFVPLEERTEIANRTGADLFLSIHANASRNTRARGVETYFLNFASNPEAEAVAARENSTSGRKMRSLPDIVRAIALNNKIDESRDFAEMVQKSMVRRLAAHHSDIRDLGVKQAPFVVLIGAGMPSVLAEISFVTNRLEGARLKTAAYRQRIAESLHDAIMRYQRSLKGVRTVASRNND